MAAAYVMIPFMRAMIAPSPVHDSPRALMARRAITRERPSATHRPGMLGHHRCRIAVTVMTTVVEPAAVNSVSLSNHWADVFWRNVRRKSSVLMIGSLAK